MQEHKGFARDALEVGRDLYPGEDRTKQPRMVSVITACGETESFPVKMGTSQDNTPSPVSVILFLTPLLNWPNIVDHGLGISISNVQGVRRRHLRTT